MEVCRLVKGIRYCVVGLWDEVPEGTGPLTTESGLCPLELIPFNRIFCPQQIRNSVRPVGDLLD